MAAIVGYDERREFSAVDPRGELTAIRAHYECGHVGPWRDPHTAAPATCPLHTIPTTNPTSKEHQS